MALLEKAKSFYALDGFVTDHCNILKEQSAYYRHLADFETDADRRQDLPF